MNKAILIGRLTRDPDIRYSNSQNGEQLCIARYTLAVDRRFQRNGDEQGADFISCVAFGRNGEFAEKYLKQGTKIAVEGRIQTGSYTNKEGQKVFTTEVVVENHEFVESKKTADGQVNQSQNDGQQYGAPQATPDGFMNIPPGAVDDLPFKK